jgi:hypothetical protein
MFAVPHLSHPSALRLPDGPLSSPVEGTGEDDRGGFLKLELVARDLIPLRDLLQRRRAEIVTCSTLRFSFGEAVTK